MPNARRRLERERNVGAVVFDLDGVLVDSEPIHFRATNRVLARFGQSIGEAEYRSFIGIGERASWTAWCAQRGITVPVAELLAAHTRARLEEIAAGVEPIAEAVALAHQLHAAGLPLALASSSTRAVIDALLAALGLGEVLAVRVSGEDPEVRASKPAPDVYLLAAARLRLAPAACVAIEDSGPGVSAAHNAGMFCVAVPNRWTADQDFRDADVVLESLRYFPLLVL
ncbi:MAG: HAD family phosphatase [Deltaproteobacteria bacterium]|nr:HAD family phosphatase [Deltaproteobacteria bacterium]